MIKKNAPIVLFVYNRPKHTKKTIDALLKNNQANQSILYIYSDYYKSIKDKNNVILTREYIKSISGFENIIIIERDENYGLSKSIIDGVTNIVNKHGRAIILEDDMVVSPYFLQYMNEALDLYEKEEKVISIHGYIYPVDKELPETFFLKGADCWGWATWKRGWDKFIPDGKSLCEKIKSSGTVDEFNFQNSYPYYRMLEDQVLGRNDSWAIRWYASAFIRDMLTLYPGRSLVENIGNDDSGMHCAYSEDMDTVASKSQITIEKIDAIESQLAKEAFISFFLKLKKKSFLNRARKKLWFFK